MLELQVAPRVQPYLEVTRALEKSWAKGRAVEGWCLSVQASRFPGLSLLPPGSLLPVFSVFHNFKTAEAISPGCFVSCSWGLILGL